LTYSLSLIYTTVMDQERTEYLTNHELNEEALKLYQIILSTLMTSERFISVRDERKSSQELIDEKGNYVPIEIVISDNDKYEIIVSQDFRNISMRKEVVLPLENATLRNIEEIDIALGDNTYFSYERKQILTNGKNTILPDTAFSIGDSKPASNRIQTFLKRFSELTSPQS